MVAYAEPGAHEGLRKNKIEENMALNTELIIIQTTKEKIRHEERRQCMLEGESLGENGGSYPGAPNALTHRLFRNSVEEMETAETLVLPSLPMSFSCPLRQIVSKLLDKAFSDHPAYSKQLFYNMIISSS